MLVGSSAPSGAPADAGAGAPATVKMRTMSLFESGDSSGAVSLAGLFDGKEFGTVHSDNEYKDGVQLICRGGWPENIGMSGNPLGALKEYLSEAASTASKDKGKGGRKGSPVTIKAIIESLAKNTAIAAGIRGIAAGTIKKGEVKPSAFITNSRMKSLKRLSLIEEQHGWTPVPHSTTRTKSTPKRHLADPSLAAAALYDDPEELRQKPSAAAPLFESLCYRDLCIYAEAIGGEVFYYCDNSELEVDFVIQLKDGRWGAIEARLGWHEFEEAEKNLLWLRRKMTERGVKEPSFMAVLNSNGKIAIKRESGIADIPLYCLGP